MTRHTLRAPNANQAIYAAAELIHSEGPKSTAELYAAIYFGRAGDRSHKISNAIASGWLIDGPGKIDISDFARAHFDAIDRPAAKYIGIPAAPREPLTPLHLRPTLKYKTDSSGSNVRDIDARFQRAAGHHFFTVSSGVA
jgi:hypothetical protein